MNRYEWKQIGRNEDEGGRTIVYASEGCKYLIESRLRHIPHASRGGTWDSTTYVVVKNGVDLKVFYRLGDAKKYAQDYDMSF